jgi:hypothetical protein
MPDSLRKFSLFVLFPLLVAVAFFVGALFFFNRGSYTPPPAVDISFEELSRTTFASAPDDFADATRMQVEEGLVLVDAAHRNAFSPSEIVTLLSRAAERGYDVEFVGSFTAVPEEDRLPLMESALSKADSFIVILPRESYTDQEAGLLERFVGKGGKLLLIADPTRDHEINSLAEPFGLEFQADYLFNQREYELNFQHIFVRGFQPDELTRDLEEVVFYTSGSIKSSGTGLAFTDENTQSTLSSGVEGPFYPLARGNHRNVLALYDLTFVIPPHNSVGDNDRLVSNIVDYLTDSERQFELADFPGFFEGDVDILLGQPSLFNIGSNFKTLMSDSQIVSHIRGMEDTVEDTVFLGLYDNASQFAPYLQASGVQIGETLSVPSISDIPPIGTSLILLNQSQDRHVLIVLAHSEGDLSSAVERLRSGGFRSGLVDDFVGVYKTE